MSTRDRDQREPAAPSTSTSTFSLGGRAPVSVVAATNIEHTAAAVPEIVGISVIIALLFLIAALVINAWVVMPVAWAMLPVACAAIAVACVRLRRTLRDSWVLGRDGFLERRNALGTCVWRGTITAAVDIDSTNASGVGWRGTELANREPGKRVVDLTIARDHPDWPHTFHVSVLPREVAQRMARSVGVDIVVDTQPPAEIDSGD